MTVEVDMPLNLVLLADSSNETWVCRLYELCWDIEISAWELIGGRRVLALVVEAVKFCA